VVGDDRRARRCGLQAIALWLLVGGPEGRTPDLRRTGLAGLLAGLAFLTRYNFVVLLPAGLAIVALGWSDVPREQRPRHLLAFVIGCAAAGRTVVRVQRLALGASRAASCT
jgi:4-amino-4-deoxy-L-arabinose transferase-like glycosyltransferase